ncbi:Uncharacterized protein Fot_27163 [Forsythia ovata]|uniref:Uncharacterized protein n=1 Tax=Forsythia ovata TaxID=205694 RepID=A0ABD1UE21_9LAMI
METLDAQKENQSTQEEIPEVVKTTTDPDSTQIKETGKVSRDTTTAQMMTDETDFDAKDYEELETIVELGNFEIYEKSGQQSSLVSKNLFETSMGQPEWPQDQNIFGWNWYPSTDEKLKSIAEDDEVPKGTNILK